MGLVIPYFVCLAAGNSEETFWVQLLVVVILAAAIGIYTLAKSRAKHIRRNTSDEIIETLIEPQNNGSSSALHLPRRRLEAKPDFQSSVLRPPSFVIRHSTPSQKRRDTAGGMELLTGDFLAGVVEHIDSVDHPDIAMRSMCWKELARRGELGAVSSKALKKYILNEGGFFDKSIRREAMAQLAGRTQKETQPPSAAIESMPLMPAHKEEPPGIIISQEQL